MRFGEFDVQPDSGELRRNGARVKLQDLPFRMLVVLLTRAGAVVTREELRAELWGAETFVDAEAGLNTAVAKLREALGDPAESPRFIETIPKRGYRFIGTVDQSAPAPPPSRRRWLLPVALLAVAAAAGAYLWFSYFGAPPVTMAVVRFHNETGSAEYDRLAGSLTDAVVVSLAENRRYSVIGNSPLLRTDRIFQDVQKIAEALKVDYLVLGQLQLGDVGLVVRAHFIRVSDQTHLWAGRVDVAGIPDVERAVTSAVGDGVSSGLAKK
jgi:DNA-binding winged helix-turn-helix (wHTH) protein/TolB-like protein